LWSCVLISRLCLSSSRVYGRAHHRGVRSSPTRRSSDLGSMWDPYGNVGKLPVAVVNHDRPAVLDGRTLHIGKDLAEELKGNDSLDFCFPSEEDAEKGLETGRYYMVITIPEDFSENAAALTAPSPEKMVLQFKTNPGTNYIASKMCEIAMKELKNSIREEVTRSYAQVMIDKAAEAADG